MMTCYFSQLLKTIGKKKRIRKMLRSNCVAVGRKITLAVSPPIHTHSFSLTHTCIPLFRIRFYAGFISSCIAEHIGPTTVRNFSYSIFIVIIYN